MDNTNPLCGQVWSGTGMPDTRKKARTRRAWGEVCGLVNNRAATLTCFLVEMLIHGKKFPTYVGYSLENSQEYGSQAIGRH